jgi:uncharacterized protein (PEP-CTERM system associated)
MEASSPGVRLRFAAGTANVFLLLALSAHAQTLPQPQRQPRPQPAGAAASAADGGAAPVPARDRQLQQQDAVAPPIFEPYLGVRATATDNSGLLTSDLKRSDVIGDLEAGLFVRRRSARASIDGDLRVDFVGYLNHTQPNGILPHGHLDLRSELVERAFFFDAAVEAGRTRADVFAPQGTGPSTVNTISSVSYRLSPYFARELTPEIAAIVRSDTVWTHNTGDEPAVANTQRDAHLQRFLARVDRWPLPLGVSLEASREDTRYSQADGTALTSESVRAIPNAAIGGDLVVGVIGGREHNESQTGSITSSRYGVMARWHPSTRTQLDGEVEHRFFGTGWGLQFRHRSPLWVVEVLTQRIPAANPVTLDIGRARTDVASMLESLWKSRYPDVSERTQAARDVVLRRQSDLGAPIDISSESAQLVQRNQLVVALSGVRTTLTGTLYYVRAEALEGISSPTQGLETRQWGGSIVLDRRLSRDTAGNVEIAWSDLDGLGVRTGEYARQITATATVYRTLSPRTTFSAGVRLMESRSLTTGNTAEQRVNEAQVFAGLRHRF